MKSAAVVAILLVLASQACSLSPGVPPTPRPEDIQTAIAQTQAGQPTSTVPATAEASATVAASPTAEIGLTLMASPLPPTPGEGTPTVPPTPDGLPAEVILILEPGVTSRVTSPVHVSGEADPTFEQTLVVEVLDENGAQLALMPIIIGADIGLRGPFSADIAFTVAAEQPGRIAVYSDSARDGGLTHYASVEVTLLPAGPAVIVAASPHPEDHAIFEPLPNSTVSGGTVHVSGFSVSTFEQNLVIEVIDADGNNVGIMPTTIQSELGQAGPFSADVPYTVTSEQPGRVIVYHQSARDGGLIHLSSVEVTLAP